MLPRAPGARQWLPFLACAPREMAALTAGFSANGYSDSDRPQQAGASRRKRCATAARRTKCSLSYRSRADGATTNDSVGRDVAPVA